MLIKGKKDGIVHMIWTNDEEKIKAFSEEMDTTEYMTDKSGARFKLLIVDDLMESS